MLAYAIKSDPFFADFMSVDLPECDITRIENIEEIVSKHQPKYIINCAAYTDVVKAETEKELAILVNAEAVKNIAVISKKYKIKLVHYSTDFVFKGDKNIAYTEDMPMNAVNHYGHSKLLGEQYIKDIYPETLVIRVSWLYGPKGKNLFSKLPDLIKEKSALQIIHDQMGKTTYTFDVATATQKLLETEATGVYHFANEGVISRFDFATMVRDILKRANKDLNCDIKPVLAADFPDPTPRPTWSALCCDKYTEKTGEKPRWWQDALQDFIEKYDR